MACHLLRRSVCPEGLLGANDFLDLGDLLLEVSLNAHAEGHLRHGAALAGTLELHGNDSVFAHVDQTDIAAMCLKRRPNVTCPQK